MDNLVELSGSKEEWWWNIVLAIIWLCITLPIKHCQRIWIPVCRVTNHCWMGLEINDNFVSKAGGCPTNYLEWAFSCLRPQTPQPWELKSNPPPEAQPLCTTKLGCATVMTVAWHVMARIRDTSFLQTMVAPMTAAQFILDIPFHFAKTGKTIYCLKLQGIRFQAGSVGAVQGTSHCVSNPLSFSQQHCVLQHPQ